jgi:uncharacterized protein
MYNRPTFMTESLLTSTQFWWWASLIIPLVVGLYAHHKITSTYARYVRVPSRGGLTGRDAAEFVMRKAGITNVAIVETQGHLTDHYDPMRRQLVLSSENYHGTSLAALGVAAHEAGHAIQHKVGYAPLNMRMGLVPLVNFAGSVLPFVMLGGFFLGSMGGIFIDIGIACYLAITLFHLITLPVEFDASRRAKVELAGLGIISADEAPGVTRTLDAAAFTYVAAFLGSIINLIYLIMLRRERE